jgi:hypothetical protein
MDQETATKMRIDSLVALITSQVVTPEEVAIAIAQSGLIPGLTLDIEARKHALKEAMGEVKSRMMTPPTKPEPEPTPAGKAPAAKASKRKTPSKAAGRQV